MPCNLLSALVLLVFLVFLVFLAGSGGAVDAASDPTVEAVQRALVERGFDPGKIDGAMGSRTRGALRAFQLTIGLPDTGEVDDATATALGLESPGDAPMPAGVDTPPDRAPTPADETESATSGAATATEPDVDTPATEAPRAEPAPVSAPDAPQSGTSKAESGDAPSADTPATETPRAEPAPVPAADTPQSGTSKAEPAPKPAAKPIMSFATLGWHGPQTGAQALERFTAIGAPADFKRGTGSLFVPKAELVFVVRAGERIPGLDCDPGAGRLSIEFVFGPDGPVIFTPVAGGEYCRMGIGVALAVGLELEMRLVDWAGVRYPPGTMQVTGKGLQYID